MVLAVVLALVEPLVGVSDNGVYLVGGDTLADAEGHGHSEKAVVYLEGVSPERLVHLVGEVQTVNYLGFGQYEEEFLTAPSCSIAAVGYHAYEKVCHINQYLIAYVMSVGVVDLLEVVDVSDTDDVSASGSSAVASYLPYLLVHCAAVEELGQRINGSCFLELLALRSESVFHIHAVEHIHRKGVYKEKDADDRVEYVQCVYDLIIRKDVFQVCMAVSSYPQPQEKSH